jgi:RNA polymerase sigma factor (sigma-70 family)
MSDKELINGILSNDHKVLQDFWLEQCTPMFHYIIHKVYDHRAEKDELINELYLYLQANDWRKLRQFDYRSQLTTWLTAVAIRFFQRKRNGVIENEWSEPLIIEKAENYEDGVHQRLDVESLIHKLSNERYRLVIQKLILEDREPQEVANEMGITVDNLYNIKRRAMRQLAQMVRKEDGYVG